VFLWALLGLAVLLLAVAFREGIADMLHVWANRPEYSHGPVVPVIAALLVWQRRSRLATVEFTGSWTGVALVLSALALDVVGRTASLYVLQQYAALLALAGVVLALVGRGGIRELAAPLLVLLFMIPLPYFLLNNFSSQMQLLSSEIGVRIVRLLGVSVHLEGNVIRLAHDRLEVAEACDGLRYMFPLMTLGFLMACFWRVALWKRVLLFASTVPISILMNSLRIAVIGVTVDRWGIRMAQGTLHDVQGWLMFMASAGLLVAEVALLSRLGASGRPWRTVFGFDVAVPLPSGGERLPRRVPVPLVAATILLAAYSAAQAGLPERAPLVPIRPSFTLFPEQLGRWSGRHDSLDTEYLRALKPSDYLMADYRSADGPPINLYVAWYDAQLAGQSAHSPRSCIPGGGWRIDDFSQRSLAEVAGPAGALRVNRALVSYGDQRQLVYYWFQQRGRVITNEYAVKWYLLVDSLRRNRSDGAMVRLTVPLERGEDPGQADARLNEFAATVMPELERFVPR